MNAISDSKSTNIEFIFTIVSFSHQVRMAERSKALDSRETLLTDSERAFWSSSEGVGSNPTSDKIFYSFESRRKYFASI